VVQLSVADTVDAAAQVPVAYEDGRFHLGTDSCAPGEARALANAYGSLDCARSAVTDSVDDRIVDWALSFDPATFGGTHGLWLDGKGPASTTPEPRIGWTRLGEYTVALAGTDAGLRDGAAPGLDGSAGGDAGPRAPPIESGCGCRAASPAPLSANAILLVLLGLGVARERRRRRVNRRSSP
jgi:MYXO-CTERM domain-containing protein